MHKASEFLHSCGTFYIATLEDGQPRVRPFGALDEFEGKLYLVTNNRKPVFAQILKNPKVEICGMSKDMKWIRIAGTAVVDERRVARAHMLEANPGLGGMYNADDGLMEVFFLKDVTATINSFSSAPEVMTF